MIMSVSAIRHDLDELSAFLSENRLREVLDFAAYLKDKDEAEERMRAQTCSCCYNDWICSENDIYDEVFGDELQKG
jgi:hypothetical protein